MKKVFSLFIACFCQMAYAYNPYCMPQTSCYSPCNECCDYNACGCRSGFYLGAQVGYAWICTPDNGRIDLDDLPIDIIIGDISETNDYHRCHGDHGDFAWGIFGGYNMQLCWDSLFVGIEGGYHGNGSAKLHFVRHTDSPIVNGDYYRHHCELRSHDWNISATFDYIFCDHFDLFLKVGGARVCEKLRGCHYQYYDTGNINFCNNCHHKWAPVIDVGGGYCLWDCLKLTASYRGVFCDHNNVRDGFRISQDNEGNIRLRLRDCATVHSIYAGAVFTF